MSVCTRTFGFICLTLILAGGCGREVSITETSALGSDGGKAYRWQDHLQLSPVRTYPWAGAFYGSPYFLDVMNHTPDRFQGSEPTTTGHETMHGLLNQMNNSTSAKDQFIYDRDGQGAFILEPTTHAKFITNYLPAGAKRLAKSRYNLYLVQQVQAYFPNMLYQFDEWNAYVTGARIGIEMVNAGQWTGGGQDVVDGAMDFLYFATAAVAALQDLEPEYLNSNEQFQAGYAMLAEYSAELVQAGLKIQPFAGFHAQELWNHFVSSPESANLRTTLQTLYGAEWTTATFGF